MYTAATNIYTQNIQHGLKPVVNILAQQPPETKAMGGRGRQPAAVGNLKPADLRFALPQTAIHLHSQARVTNICCTDECELMSFRLCCSHNIYNKCRTACTRKQNNSCGQRSETIFCEIILHV